MAKNRGGTQGFGRVSEHTRPSPYSPLQFRGNFPGAHTEAPAVRQRPGPASRGRRVVVAAAVIVMVVAGVGFVALFRPTPLPVPRASTAPAPTLDPAPGDAKQRLAPSPVAKRS
jgi:hypothetical protein